MDSAKWGYTAVGNLYGSSWGGLYGGIQGAFNRAPHRFEPSCGRILALQFQHERGRGGALMWRLISLSRQLTFLPPGRWLVRH